MPFTSRVLRVPRRQHDIRRLHDTLDHFAVQRHRLLNLLQFSVAWSSFGETGILCPELSFLVITWRAAAVVIRPRRVAIPQAWRRPIEPSRSVMSNLRSLDTHREGRSTQIRQHPSEHRQRAFENLRDDGVEICMTSGVDVVDVR